MTDNTQQFTQRCGFIAVIGAPNAGKSTFVNHMVGAHIAIVTPKVQTTRNRILGMTIEEDSQLIFIDTPGIFAAKERFEQAMVRAALSSTKDADVILLLVDAGRGICSDTKQVIDALKPIDAHKILVLNKVDKVAKDLLPALAQSLFEHIEFDACFMVSALKGKGMQDIRRYLARHMPEDNWHYPADQISDMPMRMIAAEITRESIFMRLKQELPYNVAVETENWETQRDGSIRISQVIHVRSEGQKKIIIGHQGAMLKAIGQASRTRLTQLTDAKTHLFLFVKVSEKWKENKEFYSAIGLDWKP